jgi:hypothetical protein
MNDQLEQHLRDVFRQDAERAPLAGPLAQTVLRQVRQRRRARVFQLATASLAVAVGLGVVLGSDLGFGTKSQVPQAPATAAGPTGAVPDAGAMDCPAADSASDIATRSWSFDGTITAISPPRTTRPSGIPSSTLTFEVHEWFRGGSGRTVLVDSMAPLPGGVATTEFSVPNYQVGTRLLVSGGDPYGPGPGAQRRFAGICGFTRYYDPGTADAWRIAITGR